MPQLNITEDQLARVPYAIDNRRIIYMDKKLKGFSVVVGKRSMAFYAQRDIKTKTYKVFLGRHGEVSVLKAREAAEDVIYGMRKGEARYLERCNPTLRMSMEIYLANVQCVDQHKYYVRRSCEFRLKDWLDRPLRDITRGMVLAKHRELGREGISMANDTLRAFRIVYHAALVHYEHVSLPMCPTIALRGRWYKEANTVNGAIRDLRGWHTAVKNLTNPVHQAIYLLCLYTGLRRSEACKLEWDRVLDDRIFIRENKADRPFYLPLTEQHKAILAPMRGLHDRWVFPNRQNNGPTVEPRQESIPGTVHSLRHTFASVGAEIGIPDDTIGRLLNHASGKITSRYITVNVDALRDPMQRIVDEIDRRILG